MNRRGEQACWSGFWIRLARYSASARIQTETIIALFTISDVFQTDIFGIKHPIQERLERKRSISKKKENGH